MVSIMEIMQLCRLCLVKEQVNIPIFEEQDDVRQICLKITSCLPVKITKEDKLPKKICDGCLYKLELLYQFYNTTANAEKQLLTWIEQINMDANEKNLENLAAQSTPPTVKQEKLEPVESTNENPDMSAEAQNYMLDQETFQPDFTFKESQGSTADAVDAAENSDEPLAKRPRRGRPRQATKPIPPESLDSSDNDNDNDDAGDSMLEMTVTKTEEESESEGEENVDDPEPTKFEAVGEDTEQPGPSGLGKGGADGPHSKADQDHTNTKPFLRCPRCPKTFEKRANLRKHQMRVHEGDVGPYPCDVCGKLFRRKQFLDKHKAADGCAAALESNLSCPLCAKVFATRTNLKYHLRSLHEARRDAHPCNFCPKAFRTKKYLTRHVSLMHEMRSEFACDSCEKSFKQKRYLEAHKSVVHDKTSDIVCDICGKQFLFKSILHQHMAGHTKDYKFKCDQCDKGFNSPSGLKSHQDIEHNGLRFTCGKCNKVFRNPGTYKNHLLQHEPDYIRRKHMCSFCPKAFTEATALRKHLMIHRGEAKHICEICGKIYSTKNALTEHIRVHTGEKPYVCDTCGKAFTSKKFIRLHILSHTKEKPHKCELCGKCFSQRTTLMIHMRLHSGERPYECELCDKKFITKGLLNNHIKVHGTIIK